MYTSCSDFDPLLVRHRELAGDELELVTRHLATCDGCREALGLLAGEDDSGRLEPGALVENFRVEGVIGEGGTSVVYAAGHTSMPRRVAIKVMHGRLLASVEIKQRFMRDATLVAQLRGEHVCRLTSFGELATGEPYMILEHLDGEDLQSIVARAGAFSTPAVLDIGLQVCTGLAEAHARGIVHRDIKPANLMTVSRPDGSTLVKLLDFGAAKLPVAEILTRTGVNIGSVPYMAPEQLRSSRAVDHRADLWSIGVTLYQLITGELPFAPTSAADTAIRIWTDEPSFAGVPASLAPCLRRCLAKQPAGRFSDVAELATALEPGERASRVGRILRR